MLTVDERLIRAPVEDIFALASDIEQWPAVLSHYRYIRIRRGGTAGGRVVEMSANRPFGLLNWPTWWVSVMEIDPRGPSIRYHHIKGITRGMEVEWTFQRVWGGTVVRIVHSWTGPSWPLIGGFAANRVIGPVFVHGIASRTLAGLAAAVETQSGA